MSTENNINQLFNDSVKILTDLIAFKTVSGEDNNSLINYCDEILKKLGATSFKTFDEEKKRVNLFATLNTKAGNDQKIVTGKGAASRIWFTLSQDRPQRPPPRTGFRRWPTRPSPFHSLP